MSEHEDPAQAAQVRSRRGWVTLAVAVAVLCGAAIAVLALTDRRDPSPESAPASTPRSTSDGRYLRGVNVFTLYYIAGSDPTYRSEPPSSYEYLASRGHRLIRLPIPWGELQPRLGEPFDPVFEAALRREVANVRAAGMRTVLDVHNAFRHPTPQSEAIIGDGITQKQLDDVWLRLSRLFKDDASVYAYDLMNEPYDMSSSAVEEASQGLVTAIRKAGDRKLIWVEGNDYSLTRSWTENHPKPWISDPARNFAYSAHYYVGNQNDNPRYPGDIDGDPVKTALAELAVFTDWIDRYGQRGTIGEIGWPSVRTNPSGERWNDLHEQWYRAADAAGLDVTYFGATSAYNDHWYAYDAPENDFDPVPGISQAQSQASVIERHPSTETE